MLIVAGAAAAGFVILLLLVRAAQGGPSVLDGEITPALWSWAHQDSGRWSAMQVLTRGGELVFRVPVTAAVVIACVLSQRLTAAVWAALCGLSYGLVSSLAKALVARPRPAAADPALTFQETSFPSGHSGGAMTVAILIACVIAMSLSGVRRAVVMVLAFAIPVTVGFTRMALGVHYLSDVLAGFALAWVWAMLLAVLVSQLARRRAAAPAR